MRRFPWIVLPSLLIATFAAAQPSGDTIVNDPAALQRLYGNSGVTLQWIGFEAPARGPLKVRLQNRLVHLAGSHQAAGAPGKLTLDGDVLLIDASHFVFRGRIVITDAPDAGRRCVREGLFDFRVTGKRRYWRLQQMVQCDGLTDYVDIFY